MIRFSVQLGGIRANGAQGDKGDAGSSTEIVESSGPTTLGIDAIAANQLLERNGTTIKGRTAVTATQHGAQTTDTLHALATASAHGFLDKGDKAKLDAATGDLATEAYADAAAAAAIVGLATETYVDDAAAAAVGAVVANLLINGGFDVVQRRAAPATPLFTSDGDYCADRWQILSQPGGEKFSQQAGDTHSVYAGQIKAHSNNFRMGIAQILTHEVSRGLRGQAVRFQARVKSSTSQNIRCAIVEWAGAADTLSDADRDFVADWTSVDYSTAGFFSADWDAVTGVAIAAATAGTYRDISVSGTIGASANNVAVIVWTDDVCVTDVTVDITEAGLYRATSAVAWTPAPYAAVLASCLQFYAVGTVQETGGLMSADLWEGTQNLPVPMRIAPTMTGDDFFGHIGKACYWDTTTDATVQNKPLSFGVTTTTQFAYNSDATACAGMFFNWQADAEL